MQFTPGQLRDKAVFALEEAKMRSMTQGRNAWTLTDGKLRHLVELGGLVVRSGLVELTDDERAVILGALLNISAAPQSEGRDQALLLKGGKRCIAKQPGLAGSGIAAF